MGSYEDTSWSDLRALTRQRRLEAFARREIEAAHGAAKPRGLLPIRDRKFIGEELRAPTLRFSFEPAMVPACGSQVRTGKLASQFAKHWQVKKRTRPRGGPQSAEMVEGVGERGEFWRCFRVQAGACYICALDFTETSWATEDHVKPKGGGGSDSWRNKLLAHSGCNTWKADRAPYPCEAIFLEAANLILDRRKGERPVSRFVPLRQRRLAAAAAA